MDQVTLSTFIPLTFLVVIFSLCSLGPFWTFFTILLLPISINLFTRYFRIKDSSSFYFCYTITSLLISYLVFELITSASGSISRLEYILCLLLLLLLIYSIDRTKSTIPSLSETADRQQEISQNPRNFCKKCERLVPGRDHHCIWLNVCISKSNRNWFIATLFFSILWTLVTCFANLTSICQPVYLIKGEYLLVPVQCPDVYRLTFPTISFVASIYGFGLLLFLIAILVHQLRLIYKGVTYLEYKYGKLRTHKRAASSSQPTAAASASASATSSATSS